MFDQASGSIEALEHPVADHPAQSKSEAQVAAGQGHCAQGKRAVPSAPPGLAPDLLVAGSQHTYGFDYDTVRGGVVLSPSPLPGIRQK